MLEFLPDGVQVLIFNGNKIPVLDWNLLGIWDEHPQLEVGNAPSLHLFSTVVEISVIRSSASD